jgi:hypothetical protein
VHLQFSSHLILWFLNVLQNFEMDLSVPCNSFETPKSFWIPMINLFFIIVPFCCRRLFSGKTFWTKVKPRWNKVTELTPTQIPNPEPPPQICQKTSPNHRCFQRWAKEITSCRPVFRQSERHNLSCHLQHRSCPASRELVGI